MVATFAAPAELTATICVDPAVLTFATAPEEAVWISVTFDDVAETISFTPRRLPIDSRAFAKKTRS